MSDKFKEIFIDALNRSKEIKKDDIFNIVQECSLELKPRTAKLKMIEGIAKWLFLLCYNNVTKIT